MKSSSIEVLGMRGQFLFSNCSGVCAAVFDPTLVSISGSAVAQLVEGPTSGQEAMGSISAPGASSLLFGSVSV